MACKELNSCESKAELTPRLFTHDEELPPHTSDCDTDECVPQHPIRKMLRDLFSRSGSSSKLVYKNDMYVIMDVLSRHLDDLSPDSKHLPEYLSILLNIVRYSDYLHDGYKFASIRDSLQALGEQLAYYNDSQSKISSRLVSEIIFYFK
ncbi:hypothetical protein Ciccas_006572 [Cichlidogyrus casuarinus]|uniref:SPIN90/Ldb17 leucine-rich domain-containing protein n=1 Tax=Cichlidogyrus casuarinus TaxID=1844966 RepID=A0ABD2Q6K0_9PLAT